jgi:hypothetical protein
MPLPVLSCYLVNKYAVPSITWLAVYFAPVLKPRMTLYVGKVDTVRLRDLSYQ